MIPKPNKLLKSELKSRSRKSYNDVCLLSLTEPRLGKTYLARSVLNQMIFSIQQKSSCKASLIKRWMRRRRRKTFMRRPPTVRLFQRWEQWDLLGEMVIFVISQELRLVKLGVRLNKLLNLISSLAVVTSSSWFAGLSLIICCCSGMHQMFQTHQKIVGHWKKEAKCINWNI